MHSVTVRPLQGWRRHIAGGAKTLGPTSYPKSLGTRLHWGGRAATNGQWMSEQKSPFSIYLIFRQNIHQLHHFPPSGQSPASSPCVTEISHQSKDAKRQKSAVFVAQPDRLLIDASFALILVQISGLSISAYL